MKMEHSRNDQWAPVLEHTFWVITVIIGMVRHCVNCETLQDQVWRFSLLNCHGVLCCSRWQVQDCSIVVIRLLVKYLIVSLFCLTNIILSLGCLIICIKEL